MNSISYTKDQVKLIEKEVICSECYKKEYCEFLGNECYKIVRLYYEIDREREKEK